MNVSLDSLEERLRSMKARDDLSLESKMDNEMALLYLAHVRTYMNESAPPIELIQIQKINEFQQWIMEDWAIFTEITTRYPNEQRREELANKMRTWMKTFRKHQLLDIRDCLCELFKIIQNQTHHEDERLPLKPRIQYANDIWTKLNWIVTNRLHMAPLQLPFRLL